MVDNPSLSDLIQKLPTVDDDEVAIQVIEGRALSKSASSLHLALSTGLVAVPLDSIMRVVSIPGTKDIVRLVVRRPDGIQHLLRVAPRSSSRQGPGTGVAANRGEPIGSGIPGPGVSTCDYYDTPTVTGEEGNDASDDQDADCHNDDEAMLL